MSLRRPTSLVLLLLALTALVSFAAGCGKEEETDVAEGESLELGDMSFTVQITRFLNPSSPEDSTYLEGAPPLKKGMQYLAVFMKISNDGDDPTVVPQPFRIVDTRGTIYDQIPVENPFALEPGAEIEPDGAVPGPETAAANGPIKGSMILFMLEEDATENRPLQLQVPGPTGVGTIELDL
jgi:hypothetical protein